MNDKEVEVVNEENELEGGVEEDEVNAKVIHLI